MEIQNFLQTPDMIARIFEYVDIKDLCKIPLVCKTWKQTLESHEEIWQTLCYKNWRCKHPADGSWKKRFKSELELEKAKIGAQMQMLLSRIQKMTRPGKSHKTYLQLL
jgi:hypothetical protein